jgi:2-polyprenyl-6-methoxyphenol hydroxylase-like FAD-dependent oxidoreductase
MTESQTPFDVAILGGGLAGLTLARQLLKQDDELRIAILEKRKHPVDEAAFKVGESTVEIGAQYLAQDVGLKKHLVDSQLPKFGLRFFFQNGKESIEHGIEVGTSEFFAAPGYQVDRGRLENHLAESLASTQTMFITAQAKYVNLSEDGRPHTVHFNINGEPQSLQARWVVDASGRAAILKRQLELNEDIDHHINAAWFRIGAEIRVDDWCEDQQWQSRVGKVPRRWLSTNHLLGRGYWVWIIPLPSGATSIGIVADPRFVPLSQFNQLESAMQWIKDNEPRLAEAVEPHLDKVKDFKAMKQLGYSCREVFSPQRWAITGEAGVFLDPLYSPGIDYIAVANTMICNLIHSDRRGESLEPNLSRFQSIYLDLFQDNLQTYRDQYVLFGNPKVMSLKYVWDYALYWCFPALLYFNGKMTDPMFFLEISSEVKILRDLNRSMQKLLREWEAAEVGSDWESTFVNQHDIKILTQLNAELRDRLDDDALLMRFRRNVGILKDLADEIASRVTQSHPQVDWKEETPTAAMHRLDGVFQALNI